MKISVVGTCAPSADEIRARVERRQPLRLLASEPGNFIVMAESDAESQIVASAGFCGHYFFTAAGGRFAHHDSVAGVLRKAAIPWRWNFRALADYLSFGHVVGAETLHADVRRATRGTVILWRDNRLETTVSVPETQILKPLLAARLAIEALRFEVARLWRDDGLLCITGGLDSRLILAAMLAQGIRPRLFVAGQPDCFDVTTSAEIARRFDLPLERGDVCADDFLEHGLEISTISDGMLPMSHWPGVLLAAKTSPATLFLGFGGEYARSYYHDRGVLSLLLDRLPAENLAIRRWRSRARFPAAGFPPRGMHPQLAAEFSEAGVNCRLRRLFPSGARFGESLDRAFLEQYHANKTGADLSVISRFRRCAVPLSASEWLRTVRALPRKWKLGSLFHRWAINELAPKLMLLPESIGGQRAERTSVVPPTFYWRPARVHDAKHFVDQAIYADPRLSEFVQPYLANVSELIDPSLLEAAWRQARLRDLCFALATVAMWRSSMTAAPPETPR